MVYPKFKNGEATVRDVKVAANFCKCLTIILTLVVCNAEEIQSYLLTTLSDNSQDD